MFFSFSVLPALALALFSSARSPQDQNPGYGLRMNHFDPFDRPTLDQPEN